MLYTRTVWNNFYIFSLSGSLLFGGCGRFRLTVGTKHLLPGLYGNTFYISLSGSVFIGEFRRHLLVVMLIFLELHGLSAKFAHLFMLGRRACSFVASLGVAALQVYLGNLTSVNFYWISSGSAPTA